MANRVSVRASISANARAVLTVMENKSKPEHLWRPFASQAVAAHGYPHVEVRYLEMLYAISPRIVLEWELQVDGVHRWHVKYYQTDGMSGELFNLVLWMGPVKMLDLGNDQRIIASGEYKPVCDALIHKCREVWYVSAKKRIKEMHARREARREAANRAGTKDSEDVALHMRRAYIRASAQSPDSFWAGGVTRKDDGTYEVGAGPKGRHVTTAIDVKHREV